MDYHYSALTPATKRIITDYMVINSADISGLKNIYENLNISKSQDRPSAFLALGPETASTTNPLTETD